MTMSRHILATLLVTPLPAPLLGQAYQVRDHYTKSEYLIPMRDGVKLCTIVYAPKNQSQRYPMLMTRTGYGIAPYGADQYPAVIGPNNEFAKAGYIVVYQDVRGRFRSEGEFVHHKPLEKGTGRSDESTDTYDTTEWLVQQVPNNNGRVGLWGISWGGWQVSQGMIGAHPALKAASPQAPPQDQFMGDDYHSGGAFQLMYAFSWMSSNARARGAPTGQAMPRFDYGTPDGYDFFLRMGAAANAKKLFENTIPTWDYFMEHGTYDDYWQSRNVPKDLFNIDFPVLIVAGWFDAQDFWGPFRMYHSIEDKNHPNQSTLVVGPWQHGGWARMDGDSLGLISFGQKTGAYYREQVELPFFDYYLKDKGQLNRPEALVFETGSNRWRSYDQWPPRNVENRSIYFREGGKLSFEPPPASSTEAFDSYVSDPWKPVPYTAEVRTNEGHLFMIEDQRFAATRPDVLVYQSDPLVQDLTVAGPIKAVLSVATAGTDADWVVKLVDVYAPTDPAPMGGYQMLLAGDILRGKFRNSLSRPRPMVPNQITRLKVQLGDKNHTFRRGHRIMVQVQSSWFPMFDRNPQKFVDIYHAKDSDYQKSAQRVYRSLRNGSSIQLTVLRAETVP